MNKLVAIQGYKLPGEEVWVTAEDMYEVNSIIELIIDGKPLTKFIITEIVEKGLFVELLH